MGTFSKSVVIRRLETMNCKSTMRIFEFFCTCCLVAMLRGCCFAFSAVFRETCDRRGDARLLFHGS